VKINILDPKSKVLQTDPPLTTEQDFPENGPDDSDYI
jgi:hypothetical protein